MTHSLFLIMNQVTLINIVRYIQGDGDQEEEA